jgi:hypothetical protein
MKKTTTKNVDKDKEHMKITIIEQQMNVIKSEHAD